jgi:4-amino-4-deoxy-L-arabinose transferase-like glycosyltransferase
MMKSYKGFLIFLVILFAIMVWTNGDYGITWDEPLYYQAGDAYFSWVKSSIASICAFDFITPLKNISSYWVANAQHPPLVKLITGITHEFTGSYRLAGNFFYIFLVLSVFYIAKKEIDDVCGWMAALGIAFLPRLFADGHLVELDLPLALFWLLTVYSFYQGISSKSWSLLTGLFFGLALATKVTAIFLLIPLILWGQFYYPDKQTRNLFWMFILGFPIFIISWPWLWSNTFAKLIEFYQVFFTFESPLRTCYFGYAYQHTPWHYPLVMVLLTLPIPMFIYLILGVYSGIKNKELNRWIVLSFLNCLLLIGIFSRPGALVIDGVRYFLPVFPFLCIMAAYGGREIIRSLQIKYKEYSKVITALVIAILVIPGIFAIVQLHPAQLSYYNGLIGGLRGAEKAGMEVSYWGEVITPEICRWMNTNFPPGARVKILPVYPAEGFPLAMLSFYPDTVIYSQKKGFLRKDIDFFSPPPYDYFVLVTRQGLFTEREWDFYLNTKPVYALKRNGVQLAGIYRLQ